MRCRKCYKQPHDCNCIKAAEVASPVKRPVSAFLPQLFHFSTFLSFWCVFGTVAQVAGMFNDPGWWMCYGYAVGTFAWWAADGVKAMINRIL